MYNSFEEYINEHIKLGYIDENLTPLKCLNCNSKNFKNKTIVQDEHGIMEYDVICVDCKNIVGHWAYGNWML